MNYSSTLYTIQYVNTYRKLTSVRGDITILNQRKTSGDYTYIYEYQRIYIIIREYVLHSIYNVCNYDLSANKVSFPRLLHVDDGYGGWKGFF